MKRITWAIATILLVAVAASAQQPGLDANGIKAISLDYSLNGWHDQYGNQVEFTGHVEMVDSGANAPVIGDVFFTRK